MPEGAIAQIDYWHLALSAGFVLVAGLVSLSLRLGIERSLAVASLRTVAWPSGVLKSTATERLPRLAAWK